MPEKILTIGIPTYNNPRGVISIVDFFFNDICNENRPYVEILVSDNSDNEDTQKILTESKHIETITYIKNTTNIGYDRNLDQVLEKSHGKFCWTLSDDDPIDRGFADSLVNLLKTEENVGMVMIDYTDNRLTGGKTSQKFSSYQEILNKNNLDIFGGLVSQNIFSTKLIPKDRKRFFGNLWIHLCIVLEVGVSNEVIVIKNGLKKTTDDICRWAKNGKNSFTYISLFNIIGNMRTIGYKKDLVERIQRRMAKGLPRNIASGKMHGLEINYNNINFLCSSFKKYPLYLALSLCVLFTPVFLIKKLKHAIH